MTEMLQDTMLNLTVFAYIGFLLWLALREGPAP